MVAIVLSLAFSFVLLAIIAGLATGKHAVAGACITATVGLLLSCLLASSVVMLQCVATLVIAVVALRFPKELRPNVVALGSVVAAITCYLFIGLPAYGRFRELTNARAKYPVLSLASRLNYEQERRATPPRDEPLEPRLTADAELVLSEMESDLFEKRRFHTLGRLHSAYRGEFERAFGFGASRMAYVVPTTINDVSPVTPIRLPTPQELEKVTYPQAGELPPLADKVLFPPERKKLLSFHTGGLYDFLNPDRMGYFQNRDHVIGFAPHAFSATPEIPRDDQPVGATWHTIRLELVSLLKHDQPLAYVSQNLPRMDELQAAPTRPLGEFEAAALEQLQAGEELVIQDDERGIHMLGAVRAAKDCLVCHTARRGELLGAFSYDLTPIPPRPARSTVEQVDENGIDDTSVNKKL